jgi:hypothetical protein
MRNHHSNFADNALTAVKYIGICLLAIILFVGCAFFTSCTSRSGELAKIQPEKVIVVDAREIKSDKDINRTEYKVRRLSQGVVCWVSLPGRNRYECGDTILYRFMPGQ